MLRLILSLVLLSAPLQAQEPVADLAPLPGWQVHTTAYDFDTLVERTRAAVSENGMAVVTQAGPTGAAANRGITIPGNRVIGAFNNDFAVRLLRTSTQAMIHAPIRLYVTENADGTATLSYIMPSTLLAPYDGTADIAAELDMVFDAIAEGATAR
jgi:uncharacterized protein (DUF302 family)